MATNEHPASLSALQSSVSSVSSNITTLEYNLSGIPGASMGGLTNGTSESNSSSLILLKAFTGAGALLLTHWNDAASSGSTVYIYSGADSTYPLFMKCSLAGGGCGVPLPTYVYSKTGWSVYVQNDGTNYTHIGWSWYSGWGQDSVTIVDCYDAALNSVQKDTNFSTATTFSVYRNSTTNIKGILTFDLTSIPSGSRVTNACLSLCPHYVSGSPDIWQIAAVKAAWTLAQVTWNERSTGVSWETAGATGANDIEAAYSWQGTPSLAVGVRYNFDLTELVGRWVDGTLTNNGLLIYQYQIKSGFTCNIHSRQASSSTNYPQLLVDYV